jgi:hypothetical protein
MKLPTMQPKPLLVNLHLRLPRLNKPITSGRLGLART